MEEKQENVKIVEVDIKDLCLFLITNNRYGYTRNNHLMPGCAFHDVKTYMPKVAEQDLEWAHHTLEQLCEECITSLTNLYPNGEESIYDNRQEYLDFIRWCLDFGYKYNIPIMPYNIHLYYDNLEQDNVKKYCIFDEKDRSWIIDHEHLISKNEIINTIYDICGITDNSIPVIFRKREFVESNGTKSVVYTILEPVEKILKVSRVSTDE